MKMRIPQAGEGWRHYKGDLYQIIGVGPSSDDGNATVSYAKWPWRSGDQVFPRRLDIFLGTMTDHKPRYVFERNPEQPQRVRYASYQGEMDGVEQIRMRHHPLFQIGDTVLVWVNEGDLYTGVAQVTDPLAAKAR